MVIFILISYSFFKGLILLNKSDIKTSTTLQMNVYDFMNPDIQQVNELGFDFAIQTDSPLIPAIGSIVVYHEMNHRIKNNVTGNQDFHIFD